MTEHMQSKMRLLSCYFTMGFAILPASGGSAVSFLLVIAAISGLVDILWGRSQGGLTSGDKIFVYPALIYILFMCLSLVRSNFVLSDLYAIIAPMMFLTIYFALIRYRLIIGVNHFKLFLKYIPFGAAPLIFWLIYEGLYSDQRMEGAAGNAIPFGMICALMAPLSLISIKSDQTSQKLIGIAGWGIFTFALALSETRSMYIAYSANMALVAIYLFVLSKHKSLFLGVASLLMFGAVLVVLSSDKIVNRISTLHHEVDRIASGQMADDVSIRTRVDLLAKGFCLVSQKPLLGFGAGKRDDLLKNGQMPNGPESECYVEHPNFSHFHNGFISAHIDGGVFVLIATIAILLSPLVFAFKSPNDREKPARILFASILFTTYLLAGLTNILFGHDLIDALFIIFCVHLALSVPNQKTVHDNK